VRFRYLLPATLWFFIILLVVSVPAGNLPKSDLFKIPHFDKVVHTGMFFVFTVLLNYGFYKQESVSFLKVYNYTIAITFGVIYSIVTEILQHFYIAGRSGEYWDFVANLAGISLGVIVFKYILKTPLAAKLSL
jgi:VanZ family protein